MFLSRLDLDPQRASARDFHFLASAGGAHKLVWQWFARGDERQRDFLFRVEPGKPRIWTLSSDPPFTGIGGWRSETKKFAPYLRRGDRLQFLVTVNPTKRAGGGPAAGKRHDVVMNEKLRTRGTAERPTETAIAQSAGSSWILQRAVRIGCRFDDESLRAERYRVERFSRARTERASVAMLDLSGILTVDEPERFVETITRGLGPAKAFGCGLMLIKRV